MKKVWLLMVTYGGDNPWIVSGVFESEELAKKAKSDCIKNWGYAYQQVEVYENFIYSSLEDYQQEKNREV